MYCQLCGTDNNDSSRYCYVCGAEIASPEKRSSRKTLREKLLACCVGAGAALLLFALVVYVSAHLPERIESPAPTLLENIDANIAEEDMLSLRAMREVLIANAPDGFDNFTVELDEDGRLFLISFSVGGSAHKISSLTSDSEEWAEIKQSFVDFCDAELAAIRAFCGEDTHVIVNLLNDLNLDNGLLSVTDGVVIYDALVDTEK